MKRWNAVMAYAIRSRPFLTTTINRAFSSIHDFPLEQIREPEASILDNATATTEADLLWSPEEYKTDVAQLLAHPKQFRKTGGGPWDYSQEQGHYFVDFRHMTSWEEIEQTVEFIGANYNAYHAAAAFTRLRILPQPHEISPLLNLIDKTEPLLEHMSLHHLLLIFCSTIRVEYDCSVFLEAVAGRIMEKKAPFLVTQSLVTKSILFASLARRKQKYFRSQSPGTVLPSEDALVSFLVNIVKEEPAVESFDETSCVHVLFALAQYNHLLQENREILQKICDRLVLPNMVEHLNEPTSILVLTSLANMGYSHHELLKRLSNGIFKVRSLELYQTNELAAMVYCFGRLRYWDADMTKMILTELLKETRMANISEQGIANLLYGLAQHQEIKSFDAERYVLPFLVEGAKKDRLKRFISLGLTGILYSAGLLGVPRRNQVHLVTPFVEELLKPERMETTASSGLATAFWGLGKIGWKERELIGRYLDVCTHPKRIESFTEQGLSLLIYTCGILMYRDATHIQRLFKVISRPERLPTISDLGIRTTAYGIGRTLCVDLADVVPFIKECVKTERLERFRITEITAVLRMATELKYTYMVDLQKLLGEAMKPARFNKIMPVEVQELMLALLKSAVTLGWKQSKKLIEKSLEAEMLRISGPAQLSTLALFMTHHYRSLELPEQSINRFLDEVTLPDRLAQFNPIDITNVLCTLLRIGIRNEEKLTQIIAALEEKPLARQRRTTQFITLSAATMAVQDIELRSRLVTRLMDHITSNENIALFDASSAMGMVTVLLSRPVVEKAHATWSSVLQKFRAIAEQGSTELVPTTDIFRCSKRARRLRAELPEGFVDDFVFEVLTQRERLRRMSIESIYSVARLISTSSKDRKRKALLPIVDEILTRRALSKLDPHVAATLIDIDDDCLVLSDADRSDLEHSSGMVEVAGSVRHRARQLESMMGLNYD